MNCALVLGAMLLKTDSYYPLHTQEQNLLFCDVVCRCEMFCNILIYVFVSNIVLAGLLPPVKRIIVESSSA